MRIFEARQIANDVLQKLDAKRIGAVERKVVPDQNSAARAERQALNMIFLREIGRDLKDLADGRGGGVADSEHRDLMRGGDVLFEERRRNFKDVGNVVETIAF